MNENLTDIIIVLDRSGSMANIKNDMQSGLNNFIDEQRKQKGEARITYVKFDNIIEPVFTRQKIEEVGQLTLEPRGGTALYDAVGRTINDLGSAYRSLPEYNRPGKVIFIIVTDGEENSSREFNRQQIFDMITHQRDKYHWQFVFIGADMDAYQAGNMVGVQYNSVLSSVKSKVGIDNTFYSLNKNVTNYRGMDNIAYCASVVNDCFFDEEDRKLQEEAKAQNGSH